MTKYRDLFPGALSLRNGRVIVSKGSYIEQWAERFKCPKCGGDVTCRFTTGHDRNRVDLEKGEPFWGCARWPRCTGWEEWGPTPEPYPDSVEQRWNTRDSTMRDQIYGEHFVDNDPDLDYDG